MDTIKPEAWDVATLTRVKDLVLQMQEVIPIIDTLIESSGHVVENPNLESPDSNRNLWAPEYKGHDTIGELSAWCETTGIDGFQKNVAAKKCGLTKNDMGKLSRHQYDALVTKLKEFVK